MDAELRYDHFVTIRSVTMAMLEQKEYANGQRVYELVGTQLTYYFKSGQVKAVGLYENGQMEGEWTFFRETGQLWQVGHFADGKKHGTWSRYDRDDRLEYLETFENGRKLKKQD
jgi:antitoxin component YwqK of YwqJK toxin-antitoxin module